MAFISRQKQLGKSLVAINGPSIHRYARRTVDSLRPTPILCNSTHLKAVTSHATPHRMGAFRRTALSSTRARDHFLSLWRGQAHRGHIAPDLPSHADQAAHSYVADLAGETIRLEREINAAQASRARHIGAPDAARPRQQIPTCSGDSTTTWRQGERLTYRFRMALRRAGSVRAAIEKGCAGRGSSVKASRWEAGALEN